MNSRDSILSAIKQNKPPLVSLPAFSFSGDDENVTERFINTLTSIGGTAIVVSDYTLLNETFTQLKATNTFYIQAVTEVDLYNADAFVQADNKLLNDVDTVLIKGGVAVAENGAVWVSETNMINRLLPFVCQHMILVVEEKNIIPTMHEAYENIHVDAEGYGVFIAGSSKTADIEQSLVIGAHGPLSLTVYILKKGSL